MHYLKFLGTFFLLSALYLGLDFVCEKATQGFRLHLVLSNLPNDPRWELPPLSQEAMATLEHRLDQPFTLLGTGGWCFAFLGADQHTVLKFYKHTHLSLLNALKELSFKKFLLKSPSWPQNTPYFQEFNFTSCALLYTKLKSRTGLLYAHLNKTEGLFKPVTLIDNLGVKHLVELDHTEFVVQEKAELIIPYLEQLVKEGKIDLAKNSIDDIIQCLLELYKAGLRDVDVSFRNNFGYVDNKAVALDLSSFVYDKTLEGVDDYRMMVQTKTKRLAHYLKKYQPELYLHYQHSLAL